MSNSTHATDGATSAAPSIGIVTTLAGALPVIGSFIRYHFALGVSRLYLFFDDARDPAIATVRARNDERIAIFVRGDALEREWRDCVQFGYYAPHLAREVMARQCLNVELAARRAIADRIDWLLHIDSDELFDCPGEHAPALFAKIGAAGVERAVFPNFEALPERDDDADFFREVTLFKTNRNLLPGGRFSAAQQALVDRHRFPPQFFLFYSNGKSAARVRPGLVPDGVHRFHAKRFIRSGATLSAHDAGAERVVGDARILHYACCGLDNFRDKYRTLGAFADRWFGTVDIRASIGDFHLAARDVVATGDDARIRKFYRERVMLDDSEAIDALTGAGVLIRIETPARVLSAAG